MTWSPSTKNCLKNYKRRASEIFGTSAGSVLTCDGGPFRLKQLGLPLPAALGLFSVLTDFSRPSDSRQIFALDGFQASCSHSTQNARLTILIRRHRSQGSVLSPLFADLKGMPPDPAGHQHPRTCAQRYDPFSFARCSAPEMMRSLIVFEALPHAFWYHFQLARNQKECLDLMAKFFDQKLARQN